MNYQDLLKSPLLPSPVAALVQKAANNNAPVLIQGEHGTEKELVAKSIHHIGTWKYYRFYRLDCRMLTEETFAQQLSRLLKEINDGAIPATCYLNEVGALGHASQLTLQELIEEGVFQYGSERKTVRNLRFISSSSEHLREKVAKGKFTEDLYFRLSTLSILLPPLRERANDIPGIARYLLNSHSKKMGFKKTGISPNVLKLLQNYWWPGNLRELEHVIIRSAIFSEGEHLMEKDLFFETENEKSSFNSFLKQAEPEAPGPRKGLFPEDKYFQSLSLFFIELVHRVKNPLVSIKTFTQLLKDKFEDLEFREYFYKIVTEDIEKIDSVLNGLLNYIKVNTPIEKTNTIHSILEEVLKKHELSFEGKKIKIFKKYEKDLPETVVHDEQLRYILNSLFQYALPSIPPNGSIGLLTKTFDLPVEAGVEKALIEKDGKYVEVLMVFTGFKRMGEPFETVLGLPVAEKDRAIELELRLIQEIIQKNRGMMRYEVNEEKPRTLISLRFPIERRKVVYYRFSNTQS